MRNSSDIFCLKEPKSGENDGCQIFSVNGSTSVKINRRHQTTNSVFQYGRATSPPLMARMSGLGERSLPVPSMGERGLPMEGMSERSPPMSERSLPMEGMGEGGPPMDGEEEELAAAREAAAYEAGDSPQIRNYAQMPAAAHPASINVSNMKRNPLTGDGCEAAGRRAPRRTNTLGKPSTIW